MADLAGGSGRGDIGELRRLLREARDVVAFLRSSTDLVGRATVEAGKNFAVRGALKVTGLLDLTGNMSLKDAAGNELARLGDMAFGRGIQMKRDDGSVAFTLSKSFEGAEHTWGLLDRSNQLVVGDSTLTPGLFRPHLEHPFQPVAATSGTAVTCGPYGWERTHNSATWTTLFAYDGKIQNGFLDLKFAAKCSDGTTAGEIQVVDLDTGVALPGFVVAPWVGSIPAGTTTLTLFDPTPTQIQLPVFTGAVGDQMRLGVQVRRTAGTGTITLTVAQAIGG